MPYLVLRYGPQVTRVLVFWYTFFRMVRVAQEYGLFVTLARIRGGRLTLIRPASRHGAMSSVVDDP